MTSAVDSTITAVILAGSWFSELGRLNYHLPEGDLSEADVIVIEALTP
jgi:hypothetical protein